MMEISQEVIDYADSLEEKRACDCSMDQLRIIQLNRHVKELTEANKELVEQALVRNAGDESHEWFELMGLKGGAWDACKVCGTIRRADRNNKPCRGPVSVKLRA